MIKGRNFLCLLDFTRKEVEEMIDTAGFMKRARYTSSVPQPLKGKSVALIYEKTSTRTRVTTEVAVEMLGGHPITLNVGDMQMSRGEPVEDTGILLGRVVEGIGARVKKHDTLQRLAKSSGKPVVNLLSDLSHPLQAVADLFTIRERFGEFKDVTFVGDGNDNVALSLMAGTVMLGRNFRLVSPPDMRPREEILKRIERVADETGSVIEFYDDIYEGVRGSWVVYTDVWVSMGQEGEAERRKEILRPYSVTEDVMKYTAKGGVFMHCLPAVRGEEVESAVIDGPKSVVWDQAENRLYAAMSVFSLILG